MLQVAGSLHQRPPSLFSLRTKGSVFEICEIDIQGGLIPVASMRYAECLLESIMIGFDELWVRKTLDCASTSLLLWHSRK